MKLLKSEKSRTLSGKNIKVLVKKLLLGGNTEKVVNREAMANPNSIDLFDDYFYSKLL